MELDEKSKNILVINTHKGLFRNNRLPYGIACAPAIWQKAMDQILAGIPSTQWILDDMIITGRDDDDHLNNLTKVLDKLQEYGLNAIVYVISTRCRHNTLYSRACGLSGFLVKR